MARSNGRTAAAALLGAVGYLLLSQLAAFVNPAQNPGRQLRSRVSLAATQADVDAAKKAFELQKWAASHLAGEGSPQAAAAATRAQQAEAAYMALKAQLDGQAPPAAAAAVATAPVAAAPVAAAPVAAAPMPVQGGATAVSKEDLAAAKQNAQLLTWAASKLLSEGHPQAAAMKAKADQAVAAFEALKEAKASGASAPAAPAPLPVAAAAPAVTPAAPAPVASGSAPSSEEVLKAKKEMELHEWAAKSLVSKNSPAAAAMQAKAAQSRQTYEALIAMKEKAMMPAEVRQAGTIQANRRCPTTTSATASAASREHGRDVMSRQIRTLAFFGQVSASCMYHFVARLVLLFANKVDALNSKPDTSGV
eukprot:CAMPEP_0175231490 /NCGR_PEP_ID=MMETSP0093-20121207/25484_1 /TAXON_ID=311494 /ORGANISM="Alexandrium monilatum, Strain CCMP3105" /LENGTH=363 /DNA_ID=CAMNT_0016525345 /DNA_START=60 /DNA_END=1153 /DNA_ORIENTATION=+